MHACSRYNPKKCLLKSENSTFLARTPTNSNGHGHDHAQTRGCVAWVRSMRLALQLVQTASPCYQNAETRIEPRNAKILIMSGAPYRLFKHLPAHRHLQRFAHLREHRARIRHNQVGRVATRSTQQLEIKQASCWVYNAPLQCTRPKLIRGPEQADPRTTPPVLAGENTRAVRFARGFSGGATLPCSVQNAFKICRGQATWVSGLSPGILVDGSTVTSARKVVTWYGNHRRKSLSLESPLE